jgi:hypothetical protein
MQPLDCGFNESMLSPSALGWKALTFLAHESYRLVVR